MKMSSSTKSQIEEPKRGGVRERQRSETQRQVIDAAIALFSRQGYDGTALPAIAAASGIPVPLMIYHFKSKDQLWRAAVSEVFARVEAHLVRFQPQIEQASGGAFYWLCARAHVSALAAYPEYMRIVFQEGTQDSDRLTWLVETHQGKMTQLLMTIIARAQAEGLAPAMDLAHAKFIFSGAFALAIVLGPEYRLVTGVDSLSPAFIEQHIQTCLRLLLPSVDWDDPVNRPAID
ncbi:MAG TPA: TetR/AcrR family transcriptional regulator [Sphingomonas sp.]|jgi:AcrR family transcriptional regulator